MSAGHEAADEWVKGLNLKEHLSLVSSLYGPGATGCWLMVVCSVFVSWTVNRKSRGNDKITNDFIGALTMPIVAGGHLVHQALRYPGPLSDVFVTKDPQLAPRAAAIEASMSICQTFSAMALPLSGVSLYYRRPKRFFATVLTGLFCFVLEITLLLMWPIPSMYQANLSRSPFVQGKISIAIVTTVVAILVAAAIYIWIQIALLARSDKKQKQRIAEVAIELGRLQHTTEHGGLNVAQDAAAEISRLQNQKLIEQARRVEILSGLAFCFVPFTLVSSFLGLNGVTVLGSLHSAAWRLRFFIPESNTSVRELDQVVALAGGAATLAFSCYDAYKSWMQKAESHI